jgi:hypothetical protein
MEALADRHREHGVSSVLVYVREAHPGELRPAHASLEEKLENARAMAARFGIRRRMLVDDLEGTVHRAYGSLPNMTYVVRRGGRITYRADWTDPPSIAAVLGEMHAQRERRRGGTRMTPFYAEWTPLRDSDPESFVGLLREVAGERAVQELEAAMAHVAGAAARRPSGVGRRETV